MKILEVNKLYFPWIGGVEKTCQEIAEQFTFRGIVTDVLVCQPKGKRAVDVVNGVTVFRAASFGMKLAMPLSVDFFRLYAKRIRSYDRVILHYPFPLAFFAHVIFPKRRTFVMYHSDIVRQKLFAKLFFPIDALALRGVEKIIVSNPNMIKRSALLTRFKEKCVVIPHPVRLEAWTLTDERKAEAERIGKQYGSFILAAGRLVYYKGFEYLIRAMVHVPGTLVIIGDGPLRNQLLSLIRECALEDRVHLLSHVSDLAPYYHASRLFVLPSVEPSETFGLVLLEAMACGKPVISTEIGTGTSFVNQHELTGLVVPPRDVRALAEAMNTIGSNTDLHERLSSGARARAKELSSEHFIDRLLTAIK